VRIERERSEWPPPCEGVALTHSCPPKKTTNETKVSPKVDERTIFYLPFTIFFFPEK
jgi:hypothetical protein